MSTIHSTQLESTQIASGSLAASAVLATLVAVAIAVTSVSAADSADAGSSSRDGTAIPARAITSSTALTASANEPQLVAGGSCGTLQTNSDLTYESAYCWEYLGVAAPDFGSFAECFETSGDICAVGFDLTQLGEQVDQTLDLYVWESDLDIPGAVLWVEPAVDPGPVAIWPSVSRHVVELPNLPVNGTVWAGYWGAWPDDACGWFVGADLDGPGGCPYTRIAPGVGYPTGWSHVDTVWGPTQSIGISIEIVSSEMLNPDEATAIVLNQVVMPSPYVDDLVAFLYDPDGPSRTLSPGTVVDSWDALFSETVAEESYFFWLNDEPEFEWTHHSTFAFVNAFTGELTVGEAESWPMIDGEEVTRFTYDDNGSSEIVHGLFKETLMNYEYTPVDTENTEECALVIVGKVYNNGERVARVNDVARIQEILNGVALGPQVDKDNIHVVAGTNTWGANQDEICQAIAALGPDCKKLHLFYLGHGLKGDMVVRRAGGGSSSDYKLSYYKLACKLLEAGVEEVCVTIESCYSGSAISRFKNKRKNRRGLSGVIATSSASDKKTRRCNGVGTPFYMALNECYKDGLSDLNLDGKIDLLEAVTWANDQSSYVQDDEPQIAILGDSRNVRFDLPAAWRVEDDASGDDLIYEWKRVCYKILRNSGGVDERVCRGRLYVKNPYSRPYRAEYRVEVSCVMEDGTELPLLTLEPNLGRRERFCFLDAVPGDCKRIRIRRGDRLDFVPEESDSRPVGESGATTLSGLRTDYYDRGGSIFQDRDVLGIPGESYSSSVTPVTGWNLEVDPPAFVLSDLMNPQTVVVRGDVPFTAPQGAEILSQVVNESTADTMDLGVLALVSDSLASGLVDGDSYAYHALTLTGGMHSTDGSIELDRTVLLMRESSSCLVEPGGFLSIHDSAARPDSGASYDFEVQGTLDWDGSLLAEPLNGLRLIGATGTFRDGAVLGSASDGLYMAGDLSNLDFDFCFVDSSAGSGVVCDGTAGAVLEHLEIGHASGFDVELVNQASVELQDATFDDSNLSVESGSELTLSWTTYVMLSDLSGSAIEGASIEIRDAQGTLIESGLSDAEGFSAGSILIESVQQGGVAPEMFTPHQVSITFADWDTLFTHAAEMRSVVEVEVPLFATDVDEPNQPSHFALGESFPNPVRRLSTIRFALPEDGPVTLGLYDASGRLLRRMVDGVEQAGAHTVVFDRSGLSSGVYFYRLDARSFRDSKKLIVVD